MKNWKPKLSFLTLAGVMYLVGEFLSDPTVFGFCTRQADQNYICLADAAVSIGWPLIAAGEMLAVAGVILLFANEAGLRAWWRMSRWFLPIALIAVIFFSPTSILSLLSSSHPDYEAMTQLLGIVYIITTLVILLRARRNIGH